MLRSLKCNQNMIEIIKNIPTSKEIEIYMKYVSREKPKKNVNNIPIPIDVDMGCEDEDVVVQKDFEINDKVSNKSNIDDGVPKESNINDRVPKDLSIENG